jgi:hypothetical protein
VGLLFLDFERSSTLQITEKFCSNHHICKKSSKAMYANNLEQKLTKKLIVLAQVMALLS